MTEICKEYATALFMLARQNGKEQIFAQDLALIKSAFEQNKEYSAFLSAPNIPLSKRLAALKEAFGDNVHEYVLSYIQLLCKKGKISFLFDSIAEYNALLTAFEHISKVKITSAVELDASQKQRLNEKLEKTYNIKVKAEYTVDKDLIGGVIVEIDGKVWDSSLRSRLRDIKDVIGV